MHNLEINTIIRFIVNYLSLSLLGYLRCLSDKLCYLKVYLFDRFLHAKALIGRPLGNLF